MLDLNLYRKTVEDVLRNTFWRKCDPIDVRDAIDDRLKFPAEELELCQYRPCNEDTLEALKWGSILFKSPIQFNDPFDSLMYFDRQRLEHYFHEEPYQEVLNKFCLFDAELVAHSISNCFRVSCFSETQNSPVMWSHYADNGQGYCAIYKFRPSFGSMRCLKNGDACKSGSGCPLDIRTCPWRTECSLFPVIYSDERIDTTETLAREIEYMVAYEQRQEKMLNLDLYDSLEPYKIALFKSKDWNYEKEWRLLHSGLLSGDRNQYVFPCGDLLGVVLGPKMKMENQRRIIENLKEYQKKIGRRAWIGCVEVDYTSRKYELKLSERIPVLETF